MMLTAEHLTKAIDMAHGRNAKSLIGVRTKKVDTSRSDFYIHFLGLLAEMAVAEYFQVSINEAFFVGGDGQKQDVVVAGYSTAIKYRTYTWGDLFFNRIDDFRDDLAILVVPGESLLSPRIVGWTTRSIFVARHQVQDFGYGPRVTLSQDELFPIEQLREFHLETREHSIAATS
jgi:hypothetical protein